VEKQHKIRTGKVISNKMIKTVIVAVETPKHHPLYNKAIKRTVNYMAHDEKSECAPGDVVNIIETRPLSKVKRWRVSEIITKGQVIEVKPSEIS
jgi:small subunit ribosomal protein S17